ncbi:helix-turn-helix domain-containing protein [Mesorhizobium sp. CA4]|uniref:helix-turn-helix domain-containing protein n=1 Tax=Mesorhizobium sp. CA4 TaxID=588499 RepID=UPI001CD13641|nr:helix-turn-helix domain-containing protein [Mesorhizobium sp. CA4]MBZ9823203.1 DUF1612 and helix-turn-helix domain-containing protein [Mesorhizobium sp. CA4]
MTSLRCRWRESTIDYRPPSPPAVVDGADALPTTLAAAIAADAWADIEPLEHAPWLGPAACRRASAGVWQNSVGVLPACPSQSHPLELQRPRDADSRLAVRLQAIKAAADAGLKDHNRWLNAAHCWPRMLDRRSTSKLTALIDHLLSRPIVSAGMIAKGLRVTPRASQDMVAELGLREATGRGRYRA